MKKFLKYSFAIIIGLSFLSPVLAAGGTVVAGGTCTADTDCALGTCLDGECITACTVTADCVDGRWCNAGACVLGTVTLGGVCNSVTLLCAHPNACQDGKCVSSDDARAFGTVVEGGACSSLRDCLEGLDCINDKCISRTCTSNGDCDVGTTCQSGKCVLAPKTGTVTEGGACKINGDCIWGTLCDKGKCVNSKKVQVGSGTDTKTDYGLSNMGSRLGYKTKDVTKDTLIGIVGNIIEKVLGLLGVLVLLMMVYNGFRWMTARGNEKEVEEVKDSLSALVIGLIIILSAYAITSFVIKPLLNINK